MYLDNVLNDFSPRLFRFLGGRLVTFSIRCVVDAFRSCGSRLDTYSHRIVFDDLADSWLEVDPDCRLDSRTTVLVVHDPFFNSRLWNEVFNFMKHDYIALMTLKPANVFYAHSEAMNHFQDDIVNPKLVRKFAGSASELIHGLSL